MTATTETVRSYPLADFPNTAANPSILEAEVAGPWLAFDRPEDVARTGVHRDDMPHR